MFQAIETFFYALDFRLQQIPKIVKALIHRIAKVIDAVVLEKDPEQVTAGDDSDGSPLIDDRTHGRARFQRYSSAIFLDSSVTLVCE